MSSGAGGTYCDDGSNVAGALVRLSSEAKDLLQPLQRNQCAMVAIKKDFEKAAEKIGVGVDPQVAMVIEDLKVFRHEVECKVYLYVSACRDMAEYVTDEALMDKLKEDLEAGSVEELKDFLEDMSTLLEVCVKRLGHFEETNAKFKKELDGRGDQWKAKKEDAAKQEEKSKEMIVGTGVVVGAAVIGTGIAIPVFGITALAAVTIIGGSCVGGAGLAAKFACDAAISQQQKEIFVDACQRLVKLYCTLTEVRKTAESMKAKMQKVTSDLGYGTDEETSSSGGLRGYAENPKKKTQKDGKTVLRHERMIKSSLKSLCTAMKELLSHTKSFPA